MSKIIKKITYGTVLSFIFIGTISTALASNLVSVNCPILSAELVKDVVENADIYNTHQTLIDESSLTPQEIVAQEPTANPFDFYFEIASTKIINNQIYIVAASKILGRNDAEARNRSKNILLSNNEKEYKGKYDPLTNLCIYKTIYASPTIPNYPFKSRFETILLFATDDANITKNIGKIVSSNPI